MAYLDPRNVRFLVIHCSSTLPDMDIGRREIDRWHKEQDWNGIGYHFVILQSGEIEYGRSPDVIGAHVQNYNSKSIGIVLIGGAKRAEGKVVSDPSYKFAPEQFRTLKSALQILKAYYPMAEICGHRDFPDVSKDCPCFDVKAWIKKNMA